jgi:hypothetical protein
MKASSNFLLACTHPDRALRLFIPVAPRFYLPDFLVRWE